MDISCGKSSVTACKLWESWGKGDLDEAGDKTLLAPGDIILLGETPAAERAGSEIQVGVEGEEGAGVEGFATSEPDFDEDTCGNKGDFKEDV